MLEKTCHRCNNIKPTTDFYKNKTRADGLQSYCKVCQAYKNVSDKEKDQRIKAVMKHRQTEAGKQQHRDANKRYFKTEKGREVHDRAFDKWSKTEHGKVNIRKRSLEYQMKKYWADTDYYKLKCRAYHAGTTIGILKEIQERDKVCQLCNSDKDLQFDHVYPVSLGGKGNKENLQLLCFNCNNFKSNHLFLPEGGMMITQT
jgi:hypothetical protein